MSATYWLCIDTGGDEPAALGDSVNCTYNLGRMLREAGFPDWRALVGAPASEAGGVLVSVAEKLRSDPGRFQAFNPPNGWGTYAGAIEFLDVFAALCAEHPKATVGASL